MSIIVVKLACSALGMLLLCACAGVVSDAQWAATVPGTYSGTNGNFKEVLIVDPDQTFRHRIFIEEKLLHEGAGKWTYDVESGFLRLEPFVAFYDRTTKRMTTNGVNWSGFRIAVLRYGRSAQRLSPSSGTDYSLTRQGRVEEAK